MSRLRALWREAIGAEDPPLPWRVKLVVRGLIILCASLVATLSILRFETFHNRTFDLAFYARIAWGLVHYDFWNPIVGAHVAGLHLSWILAPLGVLGELAGSHAITLLIAQAVAVALTAGVLARFGARHLGPHGAWIGALCWVLYPNVSQVATQEFHPGTVAVLPLALLLDALDRKSVPGLVVGTVGVLACREDLALVTALVGLAAARADRRMLGVGLGIFAGSLTYLAAFALGLHPMFAPPTGSLELHFGRLGSSVPEVLLHLLTHPRDLVEHLTAERRWLYPLLVTAPLGLLTWARPRYLLLVSPVLAINLLSQFPGTLALDSHYLTPAVPALVAGALEGAALLSRRARLAGPAVVISAAVLGHVLAGATPLSLPFRFSEHQPDSHTTAIAALLARIPERASVQAPDPLLAHLSERLDLRRPPPPEARTDFVILEVSHRRRFARREDLLRTIEEPLIRAWLSRPDHALVAAAGDYYLFERGRDPRTGIGARAIVGRAELTGIPLTSCLSLRGGTIEARSEGPSLVLELVAHGACPDDLALRIGREWRPVRVDLIADGLLSPAHFQAGDRIRSAHPLSEVEASGPIRIGAVRSSGARPEHQDPMSIAVDVSIL